MKNASTFRSELFNDMTRTLLVLVSLLASAAHAPEPGFRQEISTDDTRMELRIADGRLVVSRLESVASGRNWASTEMSVPLMPKVISGGREYPTTWTFVHAESDHDRGTLTFIFTNADPKLTLKSIWRARPGRGPIEHWIDIQNQSPQRIAVSQQDSLCLAALHALDQSDFWWIKRGGNDATTQGGTFTEPLQTPRRDLVISSDPEDGASAVPWLAIQEGDRGGLYVGWEFSGLGRIEARATDNPQDLEIRVGNHPDFKTDIESNETFHVPPAFVGCYAGDIDDGSYSLHRFILEKLRPAIPKSYADPTLAYNLYLDAGGSKATEGDVLRCVQTCHDLGFETFLADAMWFPETGDWRWDPARFPHGGEPIEQAVHNAGMKFGLWCAWTTGGVSPRADALSIRGPSGHPEWFKSNFAPDWKPPEFGERICLASDDAKNWAIDKTQSIVRRDKVDYLKHDVSPIVSHCDQTTHRHHYGVDASYWATLGYYDVQSKLLAANPSLLLENCSSGGGIKDFGVIQYTHYTVATDMLSNLADRQSIYDSTFAFPPVMLMAYTYDNYFPVKGDKPEPFLWRSAMMSAWQIDPTDSAKWTDAQRQSSQRATEIYKTWIRPVLADAQVHHVLPRPDGSHWDGMFYFSPARQRGTLYVFRPDAPEDQKTIRLKGLDPTLKYWTWSEDHSLKPSLQTGNALMKDGVTVVLNKKYTSDLIYLQNESLGAP